MRYRKDGKRLLGYRTVVVDGAVQVTALLRDHDAPARETVHLKMNGTGKPDKDLKDRIREFVAPQD